MMTAETDHLEGVWRWPSGSSGKGTYTEAKEVAVTCAHSGKERVAEVLGHVGHAEETDGGH